MVLPGPFFSPVRPLRPVLRSVRGCANAGCGGHAGTGSLPPSAAAAAAAATGCCPSRFLSRVSQGKNVPVLVRLISRFSCPRSGPIEGEKLNVCDNAPAMLPLSAVLLERRSCLHIGIPKRVETTVH